MSALSFVVFVVAGERLALPAFAVERVVLRPALLRLPVLAGARPDMPRFGVHTGDEIIPLLGLAPPETVIVLRAAEGRIALAVDQVLGSGPLGAEESWAGQPVRRVAVAHYEQAFGTAEPAQPFLGRGQVAFVPAVVAPAGPARVLQIRTGGVLSSSSVVELVAVQLDVTVLPVPFAPPEMLGVAVIRGHAVPVVSPVPMRQRPGCLVLLRDGKGLLAIPADDAPLLLQSSDAPELDLDGLRRAADLTPAPEEDMTPVRPRRRSQVAMLPVTVGERRYGLMAKWVERVVAPTYVARLPSRDMPDSLLDGVTAVEGRAVPFTDARRWLGQARPDRAAVHVLLRLGRDLHVLGVDAIARPIHLDAGGLEQVRDPARHVTGFAQLQGEVLAILDIAQLGVAA